MLRDMAMIMHPPFSTQFPIPVESDMLVFRSLVWFVSHGRKMCVHILKVNRSFGMWSFADALGGH